MNYFELFELPVSFLVDNNELSQKYFELQKKFHPDYYAQADEEEQELMMEKSAMINKALQILKNPDETIKYMLKLKGFLEEEEKFNLPPAFLLEVLELNELKMDGATAEVIAEKTQALQAEIFEAVEKILTKYEDGKTPNADLFKVKTYYYQKKYLDRLKRGIGDT